MNKRLIAPIIAAGCITALAVTATIFAADTINTFKAIAKGNENRHIETAVGTFTGTITDANGDEYFHFKSNDNAVWWLLTAKEMGFTPKANTEYVLTYDNKGTTKANKPCGCEPEFECECEVYDDELVSIVELNL